MRIEGRGEVLALAAVAAAAAANRTIITKAD